MRSISDCNCEYCRQTWTTRWFKNKAKLLVVPVISFGIWLFSKAEKENDAEKS